MRKLMLAAGGFLVLATTAALISQAWAACPPGTAYHCVQGGNGKVICGCY